MPHESQHVEWKDLWRDDHLHWGCGFASARGGQIDIRCNNSGSGLRADQIDLTRTRARGVRDLKHFLDYADRGPKALAAATSASGAAEAESEFERMVADRIRAAGYDVHHQVGCSGYRIDLAVVDPAAPGRYLLGIECDGATYHRAATARDRDKLRQLILEGLGWKLHRIWSTDWWHDADKEMERLVAALKTIETAKSAGVPGAN